MKYWGATIVLAQNLQKRDLIYECRIKQNERRRKNLEQKWEKKMKVYARNPIKIKCERRYKKERNKETKKQRQHIYAKVRKEIERVSLLEKKSPNLVMATEKK